MRDFPKPRWQKGFFDHVIRSENSYEQKWVYVQQKIGRMLVKLPY